MFLQNREQAAGEGTSAARSPAARMAETVVWPPGNSCSAISHTYTTDTGWSKLGFWNHSSYGLRTCFTWLNNNNEWLKFVELYACANGNSVPSAWLSSKLELMSQTAHTAHTHIVLRVPSGFACLCVYECACCEQVNHIATNQQNNSTKQSPGCVHSDQW